MIPLKVDDVLKYLIETKFKAQLEPSTKQITMIYNFVGHDFPVFIKIDEKYGTLQALLFFPSIIKPKAVPEIARLLHLINKEIDFPGLGMDEQTNLVFHRSMIPATDGEIPEILLSITILSMLKLAPIVFPLINTVCEGMHFETIIPDVRKTLNKYSNK